MPTGHSASPPDPLIERWRALALRRHAYYFELLQSERWRHYFDEAQFAARLREVVASTRTWNELAQGAERETPEIRSAA